MKKIIILGVTLGALMLLSSVSIFASNANSERCKDDPYCKEYVFKFKDCIQSSKQEINALKNERKGITKQIVALQKNKKSENNLEIDEINAKIAELFRQRQQGDIPKACFERQLSALINERQELMKNYKPISEQVVQLKLERKQVQQRIKEEKTEGKAECKELRDETKQKRNTLMGQK